MREDGSSGSALYERDDVVAMYLAFHYPDSDPLLPILGPQTPPLQTRHPFGLRPLWAGQSGRALDVGTGCGRLAFELARDHAETIGLDRSAALIRAAREVAATGVARYQTVIEGKLVASHEVPVERPGPVHFLHGDAAALPFPDASFDTVTAINLLDRVPTPARVLDEIGRVVRPGGLAIIGSPFSWLEEFTPRDAWLGGFQVDGRPVLGADRIADRLHPTFEREHRARFPFFIPHHSRSGQLGQTDIQVFRRRSR